MAIRLNDMYALYFFAFRRALERTNKQYSTDLSPRQFSILYACYILTFTRESFHRNHIEEGLKSMGEDIRFSDVTFAPLLEYSLILRNGRFYTLSPYGLTFVQSLQNTLRKIAINDQYQLTELHRLPE